MALYRITSSKLAESQVSNICNRIKWRPIEFIEQNGHSNTRNEKVCPPQRVWLIGNVVHS